MPQNSSNQQWTNSADGFVLGGGSTARTLTVSGGNVNLVGAGSAAITTPSSASTLATLALAETLTNKTLTMATTSVPASIFKGIASPLTSLTEWQTSAGVAFGIFSAQVAPTANTGVFTFYDNGLAKSSDGAIHSVHADDQSPYLAKYYNETVSATVPCMTYFAWNTGDFVFSNEGAHALQFCTSGLGNYRMTIVAAGQIGLNGITAPTAWLHLPAGTTAASTAPLKFTSGSLQTTAEAGAMEFLTDSYYVTTTTGAKRRMLVAGNTGRATAQTAAVASVATYTLGAADASFEVSANVLVTTSSGEAFTVQVTYTDEGNTARTLTLPFIILAGTTVAAINSANGAVPYEGLPVHLRCKASTAITVLTQAAGTYTGATFNCEGVIKQIA